MFFTAQFILKSLIKPEGRGELFPKPFDRTQFTYSGAVDIYKRGLFFEIFEIIYQLVHIKMFFGKMSQQNNIIYTSDFKKSSYT